MYTHVRNALVFGIVWCGIKNDEQLDFLFGIQIIYSHWNPNVGRIDIKVFRVINSSSEMVKFYDLKH